MSERTKMERLGKGKERPANVGGGRSGNNRAITSTEKTPKGPATKGGLPGTYYGNSRACKSSE
jgi:hypothetical protein